jgi:hypothetical protein
LAANRSGEGFPERGVDYFERFKRLDEWLNLKVHSVVNQGATAKRDDEKPDAPVVWLTDHGPEHIHTVLHRACRLTCNDSCLLSPYEAYLLMLAIHFHDVGNMFGRDEHERRITDVMSQIESSLIGTNSLEQRMIRDIAMVHGGDVDGDKDTIGHLRYERQQRKNEPRVYFLAALLRLADELADDYTRTNKFAVENGLIGEASALYHKYAERLRKVEIYPQDRAIFLHFDIDTTTAAATYQKGSSRVFLFDEIQHRLLKMHKELVYCSRFLRPHVHLDSIDVKIEICSPGYLQVLDTMSFAIRESGYPSSPNELADVCPEMRGQTGESLQQRIENLMSASDAK